MNYVQKHIFAPLNLSRSYFGTTPYYLARDRSHGYDISGDSAGRGDVVTDNRAEFDPGITIPNSGWNAPVSDLATYVAFLTGAAAPIPRPDRAMRACFPVPAWRRCGARSLPRLETPIPGSPAPGASHSK